MGEIGPAVDGEEGAGVVPGDHAEGGLHVPGDEELERGADDTGDDEDEQGVAVPHAIERDGHEQGAKTVNRRERSP